MAGCDARALWIAADLDAGFQPSPGAMAGCGCPDCPRRTPCQAHGFNLTRRDGRVPTTQRCAGLRGLTYQFQPSPGAMAGCDPRTSFSIGTYLDHVSTLTGAMAGCDYLWSAERIGKFRVSTLHPARWPGATP